MDARRPVGFQFDRLLEQVFLGVDVQRRQRRGAGHRVAGVGVAVEQLDHALRAVHEGVVDPCAMRAPRPSEWLPLVRPLAVVIMSG
jgi:hypothetical protein